MVNLASISNIADAKAYIVAESRELFARRDHVFFEPLASLIWSLADLYRDDRTPEGYRSHKVALAAAIGSIVERAGLDALPFAPCIFLLLKFGFAISEDTESSNIVRYKLTNALFSVFNLYDESFTLSKVVSYKSYPDFLSDALKSSNHLPGQQVPLDQPRYRASAAHLQQSFDALLGSIPSDGGLDGFAAAIAKPMHDVRRQIIERLQPLLNAAVEGMARQTLEDKKAICDLINGTLEPLGLALEDPKTGHPAQLKPDIGDWPGVGRFQFRFPQDGKTVRSTSTNDLPDLVLVDAFLPPEVGTSFRAKVGPKSSRAGRAPGI